MNKRTKFLLGIGVIAALVIGFQVAAYAVHDEVFQLEGNAVDDAAAAQPDDWANVVAVPPTDSADERSFAAELSRSETIFTGGGSKDPQDIPNWQWKNASDDELTDKGGVPDKTNLQHSFAASYTDGAQELLYFGADRIDGSGDAAIAFWFLQDDVTTGGPLKAQNGTFTGEHQTGDLLVISNFSNGGIVSTITAYEWNPLCTKALVGKGVNHDNDPTTPLKTCGAENLVILSDSTNASCLGTPTPDNACAVVNGDTTTLPWTFVNKSGTPNNQALKGEFFEGGVDLTDLGLSGQCFATAIAETRTSTSPTSVLKDFTIGEFGDCSATVETQASKIDNSTNPATTVPAGTVTPGTPVHDVATLTGSGTTPPIDPTGFVQFFLCGPIAADAQVQDCPTGGSAVGTVTPPTPANSEPVLDDAIDDGIAKAKSEAVNTSGSPLTPGRYCFRAVYSGDDNYEGDPAGVTNTTTECFTVSQPTSVTTVQRWIPQDTATVAPANATGTVTFTLYSNTDCTGDVLATIQDSTKNADGKYETNNTTPSIEDTTVSWRASFDSTNFEDSTGVCETATVTFDNDGPDSL